MPIRDCPATSLAPLKMPERESCLFSQLHSHILKDTTPRNFFIRNALFYVND